MKQIIFTAHECPINFATFFSSSILPEKQMIKFRFIVLVFPPVFEVLTDVITTSKILLSQQKVVYQFDIKRKDQINRSIFDLHTKNYFSLKNIEFSGKKDFFLFLAFCALL